MKKGYNLYAIRTKHGKSQADLAELLQTTQQQYSKYERGIQELPARHIITICKQFKVSSDYLLGLKEKE